MRANINNSSRSSRPFMTFKPLELFAITFGNGQVATISAVREGDG